MTLDHMIHAPVQGPLLMSHAHRGGPATLFKCWAEQIMSALWGPLLMSLAHRGGPVMLLCVKQSESCSHIRVRY